MTEHKYDPRFPDRPWQSKDFWRLSEAIIELDADADHGTAMEEAAGQLCDLEAAAYVAQQRPTLAADRLGIPVMALNHASVWIDGFYAGIAFQKQGGHQ